MKRYLSSLLVVALFFSNFSVLAMRKTIEYGEMAEEAEKKVFDELPDDVMFHKNFEYADMSVLKNLRLANRYYKEKVDKTVQRVLLKEFENGIVKRFAHAPAIKLEKVKELIKQIEEKLKERKRVRLVWLDKKAKAEIEIVDKENFDEAVLKAFGKFLKNKNESRLKKVLTDLLETLFTFKAEELFPICGAPLMVIAFLPL